MDHLATWVVRSPSISSGRTGIRSFALLTAASCPLAEVTQRSLLPKGAGWITWQPGWSVPLDGESWITGAWAVRSPSISSGRTDIRSFALLTAASCPLAEVTQRSLLPAGAGWITWGLSCPFPFDFPQSERTVGYDKRLHRHCGGGRNPGKSGGGQARHCNTHRDV